MSLTEEQIEIRKTGIGASEVAAVLALSPYEAPIDVWLRKRGLAAPREQNEEMGVGHALEDGMRRLYSSKTKREAVRVGATMRHPKWAHVLASPDALIYGIDATTREGGLEIKIVGSNMMHHWDDENRVPDYVEVQARQNMAVFEVPWWDVIALLGGTLPRIVRIEHDAELEDMVIGACEDFWSNFIETGEPPPIESAEERKRYLLSRYPWHGEDKITIADESEEVAQAARWLVTAQDYRKRLEEAEEELKNWFRARIGDAYGVKGAWGQVLNYPLPGRVNWQAVAEELAGGPVSSMLADRHRYSGTRAVRHYPPPTPKTKSKRTK